MLEQIILQSSNENDYVLDCFAGSGSTLKVAFKNNRKWIGVDNSDIAIDVIRSNKIGNYIFYNLNEKNFNLINNPTR